jgi:hypothetical protein
MTALQLQLNFLQAVVVFLLLVNAGLGWMLWLNWKEGRK